MKPPERRVSPQGPPPEVGVPRRASPAQEEPQLFVPRAGQAPGLPLPPPSAEDSAPEDDEETDGD